MKNRKRKHTTTTKVIRSFISLQCLGVLKRLMSTLSEFLLSSLPPCLSYDLLSLPKSSFPPYPTPNAPFPRSGFPRPHLPSFLDVLLLRQCSFPSSYLPLQRPPASLPPYPDFFLAYPVSNISSCLIHVLVPFLTSSTFQEIVRASPRTSPSPPPMTSSSSRITPFLFDIFLSLATSPFPSRRPTLPLDFLLAPPPTSSLPSRLPPSFPDVFSLSPMSPLPPRRPPPFPGRFELAQQSLTLYGRHRQRRRRRSDTASYVPSIA